MHGNSACEFVARLDWRKIEIFNEAKKRKVVETALVLLTVKCTWSKWCYSKLLYLFSVHPILIHLCSMTGQV